MNGLQHSWCQIPPGSPLGGRYLLLTSCVLLRQKRLVKRESYRVGGLARWNVGTCSTPLHYDQWRGVHVAMSDSLQWHSIQIFMDVVDHLTTVGVCMLQPVGGWWW